MKSIKNILFFSLTASLIVLTSCNKDKEDPTIEESTPEQHSEHKWENEVHLNATFSDDKDLKSYTVKIVDGADNELSAFNFTHTHEISGMSYKFHEHFEVPTNAPMMAWVKFMVIDAEDKTAEMKWMLHFEE